MRQGPLDCPDCGAPAREPAERCARCGGRLLTDLCPRCRKWRFRSSSGCWHCGLGEQPVPVAAAPRPAVRPRDLEGPGPCPHCDVAMVEGRAGPIALEECRLCGGTWLDRAEFDRLRDDERARASVLPPAAALPPVRRIPWAEVRYRPCPRCRQPMNRVHYGGSSKVILDTCGAHGWFFDVDELQRIVAWMRGPKGIASEEQRRARIASYRARTGDIPIPTDGPSAEKRGLLEIALDFLITVLLSP